MKVIEKAWLLRAKPIIKESQNSMHRGLQNLLHPSALRFWSQRQLMMLVIIRCLFISLCLTPQRHSTLWIMISCSTRCMILVERGNYGRYSNQCMRTPTPWSSGTITSPHHSLSDRVWDKVESLRLQDIKFTPIVFLTSSRHRRLATQLVLHRFLLPSVQTTLQLFRLILLKVKFFWTKSNNSANHIDTTSIHPRASPSNIALKMRPVTPLVRNKFPLLKRLRT